MSYEQINYLLRLVRRWPGTCILGRLRQLGKKRWGKRFQQFRRDAPIGNPRDPLIGFPVVFLPKPTETDNQELIADNRFLNLE